MKIRLAQFLVTALVTMPAMIWILRVAYDLSMRYSLPAQGYRSWQQASDSQHVRTVLMTFGFSAICTAVGFLVGEGRPIAVFAAGLAWAGLAILGNVASMLSISRHMSQPDLLRMISDIGPMTLTVATISGAFAAAGFYLGTLVSLAKPIT